VDEIQESDQHQSFAVGVVVLMGTVVLGAVVGCVSNVSYGVAYETFVMPSLDDPQFPYLQQAMFMAVVSGALGGAIGLSVALCRRRHWAAGILVSLAASFVTCAYTSQIWAYSYSFWGADSSDNIVYVPVFFVSLAILCLTILVVFMFAVSDARQPVDNC
jgi:hypothetical protein